MKYDLAGAYLTQQDIDMMLFECATVGDNMLEVVNMGPNAVCMTVEIIASGRMGHGAYRTWYSGIPDQGVENK